MVKQMVSVIICLILFVAVRSVLAGTAVPGSPNCASLCMSQSIECSDKVKDSPNEIERELCEKDRRECLAKCEEEHKIELEQKLKERALEEQEQQVLWEQQGLTLEEQKQEKLKQKQLEVERRREEREQ